MGVMKTADAIAEADAQGLDLVEVSPNTDPPVCKIFDYGKFKYEAQKKKNEAKKKQKIIKFSVFSTETRPTESRFGRSSLHRNPRDVARLPGWFAGPGGPIPDPKW